MTGLEVSNYRAGLNGKSLVFAHNPVNLEGVGEGNRDYLQKYDQRAIAIASQGDAVLIEGTQADLKNAKDLATYLNTFGYGPDPAHIYSIGDRSDQLIYSDLLDHDDQASDLGRLVRAGIGDNAILSPYHYTDHFEKLATNMGLDYLGPKGNHGVVKKIADKDTYLDFLQEELGINVGPYLVLTPDQDIELQLRTILMDNKMGGSLYGKGAEGVSGFGHYRDINSKNVGELAPQIAAEMDVMKRFVVQPVYDIQDTPSVIYRATDQGIYRLSPLGNQLMGDEGDHQGNLVPPAGLKKGLESRIEQESDRIARAVYELGFRGEFGVDSMTDAYGPVGNILPGEINARTTGFTPLAVIHQRSTERFGSNVHALYFSTKTDKHRTLEHVRDDLSEARLLITNPDEEIGVMPIFTGQMPYNGKVGLAVLANSREQRAEIARNAARAMGDEKALAFLTKRT